jgi:hypothetical protein
MRAKPSMAFDRWVAYGKAKVFHKPLPPLPAADD